MHSSGLAWTLHRLLVAYKVGCIDWLQATMALLNVIDAQWGCHETVAVVRVSTSTLHVPTSMYEDTCTGCSVESDQ